MPAQLTQDDLLAAIDRALPDTYLDPIRTIGPGYELLQAFAKVGERTAIAVKRFEDDVHIMTSLAGVLATVPATFYREVFTAGAGTMLAGTVVRASVGGQVFRTTADVAFGPTDLETGPVTAIAVGFGYEWNISGPFTDPQGNVWPGELDTIDLPLQNPVFFDDTIQVRNDAPADGLGRPRTLDALGAERRLPRQPNEDDANYQNRIRTLPDTVAPAAIRRQLTNYFRRIPGLFWHAVETWQHEYQECYDAPDLAPIIGENYNANLFCYDDPRPPSPIANRYLGENDYLGAFIVEVAMPPPMHEFSLAYDDPAGDAVGPPPSIGTRALSAYDLDDSLVPPAIPPAYDGADYAVARFFTDLYAILDEIKAGGVFVVIHIQET
jgi:hypothetical protein